VNVSNSAQLLSALSNAKPGQTIVLASGTYLGAFTSTASGTSAQPITLKGPKDAIVRNDKSTGKNYGLYLNTVNYWVIDGFTVNNSQKGIVLDASNFNILRNLTVHDVEDEAIHFRSSSSNNTLENSRVFNTGRVQPGFGEAVYIGSAKSNWSKYGNTNGIDASHNNKILNNELGPNITAECIDVKEGTRNGLIQGNVMMGDGITEENFADSVVDMKGDNYLVTENMMRYTPTAQSNHLLDGFQIHGNSVNGVSYGNDNVFSKNTFNLNTTGPEGSASYIPLLLVDKSGRAGHGYAVQVQSGLDGNVICTNNSVTNAASTGGLTNIATTVCQ
jgi:parallel beta-helix repeat protein